jgi:parallel beta-helix repeat protein
MPHFSRGWFIWCWLLCLLPLGVLAVDTNITQNTTWTAAASPYVLHGNLYVAGGVTLTVEPGATVQFDDDCRATIEGTLSAVGTPEAPIVFTTSRVTPAPGAWKGIYFAPTADASTMRHCTVSYAGHGNGVLYLYSQYRVTSILCWQANVTIEDCTLADSGTHGIELIESSPTLRNLTISGMRDGYYPLLLRTTDCFPTMSGITTAGAGPLSIWVCGGTFGEGRWPKPGPNVPYYLSDSISVSGPLTIDPGVTVTMAGDRAILVTGTLLAEGTAEAPIVFTSAQATPARGAWKGIYFGENADASRLRQCTISYAGSGNSLVYLYWYRYTAVMLNACDLVFDHVTIAQSAANGLEMRDSSPTLTHCAFTGCAASALRMEVNSAPTITDTAIAGCTDNYAVSMDAGCNPSPTRVTFANNRYNGIEVRDGTIATTRIWQNWSVPYAVTGNVGINENVTLTLAPATTLKLTDRTFHIYGTLIADGTHGRITFTSLQDDTVLGDTNGDGAASAGGPGQWRGIYLAPSAGASLFHACDFRYAGHGNSIVYVSGYRYATVFVYGCSPTFTSCTVRDSGWHGIELQNSSATIRDTAFANMAGPGYYPILLRSTDCYPVLSGNTVVGTGTLGVWTCGGYYNTGRWMKPGENFPYYVNNDHLNINGGQTLTLDPGVTLKMGEKRIHVYGTLLAEGTAAQPIVFTSQEATPAAGNWRGIYFDPNAGGSRLIYCTVAYAGNDNSVVYDRWYRYASLYTYNSSPTFDHLTLTDSYNHGIECSGGSPIFTNLTVARTRCNGLRLNDGSAPTLTDASFTQAGTLDGYYAVNLDANCRPDPTRVAFTDCARSGVQIRGGTMSADTRWKRWAANAPYAITGDTQVDATLTVDPGVTLKFWVAWLRVYGRLVADGTPERITVTSLRDDTVLGDTNGDGATSAPAAGDWSGIYLQASGLGTNVLNRCDLRYAGNDRSVIYVNGAYRYSTLVLYGGAPCITNCTLVDSRYHFIETLWSAPVIRDCVFTNIPINHFAIVVRTTDAYPVVSGNVATGDGYHGIYLTGGGLAANTRWMKGGEDFPWFLLENLTVPAGLTLTLDPGVTIKARNTRLQIDGTLRAVGTPGAPVIFTSANATPARGDWKGIYLTPGAGNSLLRFCQLRYGGQETTYLAGWYRWAQLVLHACAPRLENLVVEQSVDQGIELQGASPTIVNSLFRANTGTGILMYGDSRPLIANNTFVGNRFDSWAKGAISIHASSPTIVNNIFVDNQVGIVSRDGGTPVLRQNCLWQNVEAAYTGLTAGATDMAADPRFVEAAAGNYRLQADSPCVNTGDHSVAQVSWKDLDGRIRCLDGAIDIGAYEYATTGAVYQPDLQARALDVEASLTGDGLYTVEAQTSTEELPVDVGVRMSYEVVLENDGTAPDRGTLRATRGTATAPAGGAPGWGVRVFLADTGEEITAALLGDGWTSPEGLAGAWQALRVEITAEATLADFSQFRLTLTAASQMAPAKTDAMQIRLTPVPSTTTPVGKVYTTNADFDLGHLVSVAHDTVADQLQLTTQATTFPFIWVPNSNEGTVSKVDTVTGKELGRYRTCPHSDASPSRTTVDLYGNCWVGNRQRGTVVKIGLLEADQFLDRNGNGRVETSRDLNGDGVITGSELLPWGQDECVLWEVVLIPGKEGSFAPGTYTSSYANDNWTPGPRGLAVDAQNNVWAGCYGTRKYYYLNGETGQIQRSVDLAAVNFHPYGAVIDTHGILWTSENGTSVLRLDPADDSLQLVPVGHSSYGVGIDGAGHLFCSGWQSSKFSRINTTTNAVDYTKDAPNEGRGVTTTPDGDIWVAHTGPGTVSRWSPDGTQRANISVGGAPTGVSVDAAGKVWVVCSSNEYIHRIDPSTNTVDLSKALPGTNHYGYSDMTGIVTRTLVTRLGTWLVTHDSTCLNSPWGIIAWSANIPEGTSITVRARSTNNRRHWSEWVPAVNGEVLATLINGKYLQLEVTFRSIVAGVSPILTDLTVTPLNTTGVSDLQVKLPAEEIYAGDDVYNDLGAQTKAQHVSPGAAAVYQVQTQNDGMLPDTLTVTVSQPPTGWTVRLFEAATGGTELPPQAHFGWALGPLGAGETRTFRVEVTPSGAVLPGASLDTTVSASSARTPAAMDTVALTTTRRAPTAVTVGVAPQERQVVGKAVTLTAQATGGGPVEYQFRVGFKSGANYVWTTVRAYGPSALYSWTPSEARIWSVVVWAREVGSTRNYDAYCTVAYTIVPPLSELSIMAAPRSPRPVLTPITLTTAPVGGATVLFRFRVGFKSGTSMQWITLRDYAPERSCVWTPTEARLWSIAVYAKEATSTKSYDVYKTVGYLIYPTPPTAVALTASPTTGKVGVDTVLQAIPTGGTHVQYWYRFGRKVGTAYTWQTLQAYTDAAAYRWTPSMAGAYILAVYAREVGDISGYNCYKTLSYMVKP